MDKNKKIHFIYGIVLFVLLVTSIFLGRKISLISDELEKIAGERNILEGESKSAKEEVALRESEIAKIKKFISLSKVLLQDSQELGLALQEFNLKRSSDARDKYRRGVETIEAHINEYKDFLSENEDFLDNMGIDVKNERDQVSASLELYYDILSSMDQFIVN